MTQTGLSKSVYTTNITQNIFTTFSLLLSFGHNASFLLSFASFLRHFRSFLGYFASLWIHSGYSTIICSHFYLYIQSVTVTIQSFRYNTLNSVTYTNFQYHILLGLYSTPTYPHNNLSLSSLMLQFAMHSHCSRCPHRRWCSCPCCDASMQ